MSDILSGIYEMVKGLNKAGCLSDEKLEEIRDICHPVKKEVFLDFSLYHVRDSQILIRAEDKGDEYICPIDSFDGIPLKDLVWRLTNNPVVLNSISSYEGIREVWIEKDTF